MCVGWLIGACVEGVCQGTSWCVSISLCVCQVGDGTTSVTLLAAEFLRQLKPYVEDGLHPQTIIRAFRSATHLAVAKIREIAVTVKKDDKK